MTAPIPDRAWKLLEPEGAWTQGVMARDQQGCATAYLSKDACQWCVLGAIYRIHGWDSTMRDRVALALNFRSVGGWNDAPERTQAEVVALLKSLGI